MVANREYCHIVGEKYDVGVNEALLAQRSVVRGPLGDLERVPGVPQLNDN